VEKTQHALLLLHFNNGYANAPQCCLTRALPMSLTPIVNGFFVAFTYFYPIILNLKYR